MCRHRAAFFMPRVHSPQEGALTPRVKRDEKPTTKHSQRFHLLFAATLTAGQRHQAPLLHVKLLFCDDSPLMKAAAA